MLIKYRWELKGSIKPSKLGKNQKNVNLQNDKEEVITIKNIIIDFIP